jgi:hypothetical protein
MNDDQRNTSADDPATNGSVTATGEVTAEALTAANAKAE